MELRDFNAVPFLRGAGPAARQFSIGFDDFLREVEGRREAEFRFAGEFR